MRYGSVCSGIEAATVAWHPLGWTPAFFSEIEKFPSAVLAHHYGSNMPGEPHSGNGVPNYGDMTKFEEWPDERLDVLVGGTPCQSFSIAGLRKGLDDPRGNLMLTYLAIAKRYRSDWLVWENVPGVLSSNEGRDFGTFIRGMEECGYHAAWRVLDAQYVRVDGFGRAVPQRRRRVFVVGYLGDWRRAAAVLFEPEGMSGHPAPRRKAGQGTAATVAAGVASCLNAHFGDKQGLEDQHINQGDTLVTADMAAAPLSAQGGNNGGAGQILCAPVSISADALRSGEAKSDSPDASGVMRKRDPGLGMTDDGSSYTLTAAGPPSVAAPVAFDCKASGRNGFGVGDVSPTLRVMGHFGSHQNAGGQVAIQSGWRVRRLTPTECERLQGFPDGYTAIPWRGKASDACPDGPRYKALGNSMAVNVMRWIGRRIEMVALQ